MNVINLIGNLTRDIELRTSASGVAVAKFSIAINSGFGDKKRTDYPNIICFGKTAETAEKWLTKGSKVAVTGRLQTGSYKDKDGKTVYTTDVLADRLEFLSTNKETTEPRQEAVKPLMDEFEAVNEELPF